MLSFRIQYGQYRI